MITESAGIPLGLAVAGANVVDFKLARDTILSIPIKRPRPTRACPKGVCARQWVVERTHSWMNRCRRILVRWKKRADTYVALLHLAFALITWRACAALG